MQQLVPGGVLKVALAVMLGAVLAVLHLRDGLTVVERVSAPVPEATMQQRARLLGLLWAKGVYDSGRGEWSYNTFVPRRAQGGNVRVSAGGKPVRDAVRSEKMRALLEFLGKQLGGTVRSVGDEVFIVGLPWTAPWSDGTPDELAVHDVNFLAGVMDGEGPAPGLINNQNACCGNPMRVAKLYDLLTASPSYRKLGIYLHHPKLGELSREQVAGQDHIDLKLRATHLADVHDWGFVNVARVSGSRLGGGGSAPVELEEPWELIGEDVAEDEKCFGLVASVLPAPGKKELYGTRFPDIISGSSGSDIIYGRGGDDVICGADGKDEIHGGDGDDRISGDGDDDLLHGDRGNDRLFGGSGRDVLFGDRDDDRLSGGDGDDRLFGGLGHDELFGDEGTDRLRGNEGQDRLFGGEDKNTDSCFSGGQHGDRETGCP